MDTHLVAAYTILGGGCSGLMLALSMVSDPYFKDKKIILIEKEFQKTNDRTWSFWDDTKGPYHHLAYRQWEKIIFKSGSFQSITNISPYKYYSIKGEDFYTYAYNILTQAPNVTILFDNVTHVSDIVVYTTKYTIHSEWVFDSIFDPDSLKDNSFPTILQHFVGWEVHFSDPVFDPHEVTFMDFESGDQNVCRFMYILPIDEKTALVESTFFTDKILEEYEYEDHIRSYLLHYYDQPYDILQTEKGVIPMTALPLGNIDSKRHIFIGTAGGWAKPSTGYVFKNATRYVPLLIQHIKLNKQNLFRPFSIRHRFWDQIMIEMMLHTNVSGITLFTSLFKHNSTARIFRFLDEQSSFFDDMTIMWHSKPKLLLIRATFKSILLCMVYKLRKWAK